MKIRSSIIGAVVFTGLVCAYIGSGYITLSIFEDIKQDNDKAEKIAKEIALTNAPIILPAVEIVKVSAKLHTATISIPAQSEVLKRVRIAAETGGVVLERPFTKGHAVTKGDLLCKIDMGTRLSDLAQAQAGLAQAEIDYYSAVKLVKLGHAAKTREIARKAQLDGATAAVKRAEKDIERVEIKAPFDGIVESAPAKVGGLLSPGAECATISNSSTMLIVGNISERDIGRISIGLNANIDMITGDKFSGKISFISPAANPRTRTFRVDVTVDNPEFIIRDGMTSQIRIELEKNQAHFIRKSLLTLNDSGVIGVRIVNKADMVEFHPVKILSDKKDGVWVSGLNSTISLISIGHEYVSAGQKVNATLAEVK